MAEPKKELEARIDEAVAATSGVKEQYSARSTLRRAARRFTDAPSVLSLVEDDRGRRRVTVCIGVTAELDSSAVALDVAAAVRELLAEGEESLDVRVRVSRLIPSAV